MVAAAAGIESFVKNTIPIHTISNIIEKRQTALFLSTIDITLNNLLSDLKSNYLTAPFLLRYVYNII